MKRVSFMQQRSHSCGDISPTETDAGWFDEEDNDEDIRHDDNNDDDDDDDDLLSSLRQRARPRRPGLNIIAITMPIKCSFKYDRPLKRPLER